MKAPKENNQKLVLTGLLIGLIFSGLDETVVSTAMPTIVRELHGLPLYGWVAGIYMLAVTVFMPILGKMADLYGRKKIYIGCMGLFIAGSVVSGLADSMSLLLLGRAIQGVGAGGLMPLAMVIIGDMFELKQRAKIQSLVGPLMFVPQLIGPALGGFMVGHMNWHWVFLINIPIGVLSALVIHLGLNESRGEGGRTIDWAGALALVATLLSLLVAPVLVDNEGYSWHSPLIVGLLAASVLFALLLIRIEARVKEPIIPLHLFRNRNVLVLSALCFTVGAGVIGGLASFPFFAQNVMGLTPTASGYLTLALMVGAIPSSMLCGYLLTRVRYRLLFIVSFAFPIAAFAVLTGISATTTVPMIVACLFVLGLGMGALFGGDNLIVQESVDKAHSGIALSTVQLLQSVGMTIGLSVFGSLIASSVGNGVLSLGDRLPAGAAEAVRAGAIPADLNPSVLTSIHEVIAHAFSTVSVIALVFAALAFLLCFFLGKDILTPREAGDEAAAVRNGEPAA